MANPDPQTSATSRLKRVDAELAALEPRIVEMRRHLHRHPELSLKETATTAYIGAQLESEGIPYRLGNDGRGLMVDLDGPDNGPLVAMRADCDALPILEENSFDHASCEPGVMHACGHDGHTAMLLGAFIAMHRAHLGVRARAIFQPAEEAGDGALGMIADGALEGVSSIIALHVDPALPVGKAAAVEGPQSASCQDFEIIVHGRGGHAARPHLTIDPVAIAANLITQIYQTVPRHIDSRMPAVVSICQIHAGHASNVIPESARLNGTIRSHDNNSATVARDLIAQLCMGLAQIHGATIVPTFDRKIPGVINDSVITQTCAIAARSVMGSDYVITTGQISFGAEDFADYLQHVPGCMMRLGVKYPDRGVTPLHTPTFDIDERALLFGSRLLIHSFLQLSNCHVD